MRKLIVATIMSLDGYVEGPGGNVMALPMDGFFDAHNLERQRAADTLLLGANTYLGFKSYWPAVAEDSSVSPAVAVDPAVADVHRETGRRNNELHKVVVSDSLTEADTAPWIQSTAAFVWHAFSSPARKRDSGPTAVACADSSSRSSSGTRGGTTRMPPCDRS